MERKPQIAFLLPNLRGGGVQRMVTILAAAMVERGVAVDLLVQDGQGELAADLPAAVKVVPLAAASPLAARWAALRADPWAWRALLGPILSSRKRSWKSIVHLPALADHLRSRAPHTLFAATPYLNIEAVLARRLAGTETRLVLSERTQVSDGKEKKEWRSRSLARLVRHGYVQADAIVAVSHGVADDLAASTGVPRDRITVLHNPTLTPDVGEKMQAPVDHPWFSDAVPIVVSVGRVSPQKDFDTLLRGFARATSERKARLVIIGAANPGPAQRLRALAEELAIADRFEWLGFQSNPLRYVSRAALFVLSSRFEGFPNVLLEALACGTPVVSTDCPSGPHEILDGGRYGELVPVGDDAALAAAMSRTLDAPPPRELLRARAAVFDYPTSVARYAAVLLGSDERAPGDSRERAGA